MILSMLELPYMRKASDLAYNAEIIGTIFTEYQTSIMWNLGRRLFLPSVLKKYKFIEVLPDGSIQERWVVGRPVEPLDPSNQILTTILVKPIGHSPIYTAPVAFIQGINALLEMVFSCTQCVQSITQLWVKAHDRVNTHQITHSAAEEDLLRTSANLGLAAVDPYSTELIQHVTTAVDNIYGLLEHIEQSYRHETNFSYLFNTQCSFSLCNIDPLSILSLAEHFSFKQLRSFYHPQFGCCDAQFVLQSAFNPQSLYWTNTTLHQNLIEYPELREILDLLVLLPLPHLSVLADMRNTTTYDPTGSPGMYLQQYSAQSDVGTLIPQFITTCDQYVNTLQQAYECPVTLHIKRTMLEEACITICIGDMQPIEIYVDLMLHLLASDMLLNVQQRLLEEPF